MNFVKISCLCLLFIGSVANSQDRITAEFGKPTAFELQMKSYPKSPEANGVVLFEKGINYVKLIDNKYVRLIKKVHKKIKVIDAKNFKESIVIIPFYQDGNLREEITSIEVITHNGNVQTFLQEGAIYETKETENWYFKRFTFPNIKDGSVLEYSYTIESPFYFNFGTWKFQGSLPKMYSEFVYLMPGNYIYRRSLIGSEKLDINQVSLLEDCFSIPGYAQNADCEVAVYAMHDVPLFKEEDYMLSSKNYLAAIKFELVEYTNFKGNKTRFTKEWRNVDKEFRTDKDMGGQLKFENFFEGKLPPNILLISDELERAKAVYYFVQDHFIWNGRFTLGSVRVKEAFEDGDANNTEINLALINTLNAANIDAKMVLLATRNHGIPTQLYPVLTDFNHVIASAHINGTTYLLDANSKVTPFGILPFWDLNGTGRLMDFKEGSYWIDIEPYAKNNWFLNAQLQIDENSLLSGTVAETYTGYKGMEKRSEISEKLKEEYLKDWESQYSDLEIVDYTNENITNLEENFKETYTARVQFDGADQIFLYPFLLKRSFTKNPFTLDNRNYPIDFGHPTIETFLISIDLGNQYKVLELPENKIIKIPGGAGECSIIYGNVNGKLTVRYTYKLLHHFFLPEAYESLKEFFFNVVSLQNKEVVTLQKI